MTIADFNPQQQEEVLFGRRKKKNRRRRQSNKISLVDDGSATGPGQNSPPLPRYKIFLFLLSDFGAALGMMYSVNLLLPIQIAQMVDPTQKSFLLAFSGLASALVGIAASLATGVISDRIRTTFGRRKPCLFVGVCLFVFCLGVRSSLTHLKRASPFKIVMYMLLYCVEVV